MRQLRSVYIRNDYYSSNEAGSAVFSKDGTELVSASCNIGFEISDSVRVIKKRAFACSFIHVFNIPQFVEEIENGVFFNCFDKPEIIFSPGSKLKKLGFKAFEYLKSLRIDNENFHTTESGVVMSNNPRGIVFVPKHLTSLTIDPGIEVIYSCAFYKSNINQLFFPINRTVQ